MFFCFFVFKLNVSYSCSVKLESLYLEKFAVEKILFKRYVLDSIIFFVLDCLVLYFNISHIILCTSYHLNLEACIEQLMRDVKNCNSSIWATGVALSINFNCYMENLSSVSSFFFFFNLKMWYKWWTI